MTVERPIKDDIFSLYVAISYFILQFICSELCGDNAEWYDLLFNGSSLYELFTILQFWSLGPENMDPMELDLRMKMAEVQMKYKQEQKELARLQRKSCE